MNEKDLRFIQHREAFMHIEYSDFFIFGFCPGLYRVSLAFGMSDSAIRHILMISYPAYARDTFYKVYKR